MKPWEKAQIQAQSSQGTLPWEKAQSKIQFSEPFSAFEDRYQESSEPEKSFYEKTYKPVMGERTVFGINPEKIGLDIAAGVGKGLVRTGAMAEEFLPGVSGIAKVRNLIVGKNLGDEAVSSVEEAYKPSYPAVEQTAAILGPTMLGGAGAIRALPQGAGMLTKYLAGALGGAAGETASKERGTGRLIVGKDSLFNLADGFNDETKMGALANDFLDAVAIGFPGEAIGDSVARVLIAANYAIIKPVRAVFRGGDREKTLAEAIGREIVENLDLARQAKTPQERSAALKNIAQTLRDNQEVVFKTDQSDIKLIRDSMSAISEGAGPDEAGDLLTRRASQLRAGDLASPETAQLAQRVDEPFKAQQQFLGSRYEQYGGLEGAQEAEEGLRKQGQKFIQEKYDRPVELAGAKLTKEVGQIPKQIAENLEVTSKIKQLEDKVDIDVLKGYNLTVDSIRESTLRGKELMDKEMKALLQKIPSDTKVDLSGAVKYLESADVPKTIKTIVQGSGGNYKELYEKAIPQISNEIGKRIRARVDASDLKDLRNWIYEAGSQNKKLKGPLKNLTEHYKTVYAPIWRDGILEDFIGSFQQTVGRGPTVKPTIFEVETDELIDKALKNPKLASHLTSLLGKPGVGSPKQLTDAILSKAAGNLQKQINRGVNLREADINSFVAPLEEYGATLAKIDPKLTDEINGWLTRVRDTKGNIQQLEKELDWAVKLRETFGPEDLKAEYGEFFKTEGVTGTEGFEAFFKQSGSEPRLERLLDRALTEGDQKTVVGIKGAYIKQVKEQLFGSKALSPGRGTKTIDITKAEEALTGEKSLFKYGDIVFKDTPQVMDALRSLTNMTKKLEESTKSGKQLVPFNYSRFAKEASTGIDKLITLTMGVLNRLAARGRAIKGAVVPLVDPKKQAQYVADKLMANPEYLADVLDKIADIDLQAMSESTRIAISEFLTLMLKDRVGEDIDMNTELNKLTNQNKTDKQTQEIFQ